MTMFLYACIVCSEVFEAKYMHFGEHGCVCPSCKSEELIAHIGKLEEKVKSLELENAYRTVISNAEKQHGSVGKVSKFNMIYNGMENDYTGKRG